jgi:hypothetical protein
LRSIYMFIYGHMGSNGNMTSIQQQMILHAQIIIFVTPVSKY